MSIKAEAKNHLEITPDGSVVNEEFRFLAAIVQSSEDAIIGEDLNGIINSWNPAAEKLFGYSEEEANGQPITILGVPDHLDEFYEIIEMVRKGHGIESHETRRRRKDGILVDVSVTASPVNDGEGTLIGISLIDRDITAQKQASQYARSLIEASLDPLVTISPDGKITDVNEATIRATGMPREKLIGTDFSSYFTEPDKAREGYQLVFSKGTVTNYPLTIRHHDGSLTDVLYNASVYKDVTGNVLGVFAAARDITERKLVETALRESETRYRSLFQNSPISLWEEDFSEVKKHLEALRQAGVTDFAAYFVLHPEVIPDFLNSVQVLDVNRATLELMGAQSKQELIGSLGTVLPGEISRHFAVELVHISEGKRNFGWEDINRMRDGRLIQVSLNWSVMPGYEDSLSKVIVSSIDITERKQAEIELLAYRDHLEELVQTRTAELVLAKQQADYANRAKSDFLAMMSHEIRTPLHGILGLTQLALEGDLDANLRNYLTHIQLSGEILLATINDILDFSKIEASRLDLEAIQFSLNDILQTISSSMVHRAKEKGLVLAFSISPEVPRVLIGDPLRLGQVLLNLVSNAVKFTERGKVDVEIALISKEAHQVELRFSVCDTGIGMTETQIEQMFRPFSQADNSISRRYGGTGLGLAISKSLIEMMGGTIEVESKIGQGSRFSFTLVFLRSIDVEDGSFAQAPDEKMAQKRLSEQAIAGADLLKLHGKRILLVEDNVINQMVALEMLQRLGLLVSVAVDGEQAIAMIHKNPYDAVLMDIEMPGMDGYQATLKIRSNQHFSADKLPIIAMTAHALTGEREKALKGGMNDYVSKPVDAILLTHTLMRWLAPESKPGEADKHETTTVHDVLPAEILAHLNTAAALTRLGGNMDLYERLLKKFHNDYASVVKQIRGALQVNDLVLAQRQAHTLKSVAAALGAEALSDTAKQLELAIKTGDQALFNNFLAETEDQINVVLADLAKL
jgi:PAS domain S-box-containing protein